MKNNIDYLIEFRQRFLRVLMVWGVIALTFSFFANNIYTFLAMPLLHQFTEHQSIIATAVSAPFFVPLQSAMMLSIYVCVPLLLYQLWQFTAPALYQKERRLAFSFLLFTSVLFYLGSVFAYYVVLPLFFQFATHFLPKGVTFMPDMSSYFAFVMRMLLAFSVAFELPVLIVFIIWCGFVSRDKIAKQRPYVIVSCFIIGMLIAPPDVFSQTLLAMPLWGLFELGLLISRMIKKRDIEL